MFPDVASIQQTGQTQILFIRKAMYVSCVSIMEQGKRWAHFYNSAGVGCRVVLLLLTAHDKRAEVGA